MNFLKTNRLLLVSALLFTFLFYRQTLGLNVLLFECVVVVYFFLRRMIVSVLLKMLALFVAATAVFTVVHHSDWNYWINFLLFFIFIGSISAPEIRSIPLVAYQSFTSLIIAQGQLPKELFVKDNSSKQFAYSFKRIRLFAIPVVILTTFIVMYSASNPKFGQFFDWFSTQIWSFFETVFAYIEFNAVLVFVLGLTVAAFLFIHRKNRRAIELDAQGNDRLQRVKLKRRRKTASLRNEYRSAVFLFFGLNALLLFLNTMDIYWVWFQFKWEGQFLKDFVHQGTFLLLVSIVISIALVLYFFRANIHFYSKNQGLKRLTYLWLIQNAVLVISVGIRNWYYIEYYALAYKRVAIVFFLILTLVCLFTVFRKVSEIRSAYYLVRVNSLAVVIILVFSTGFNWDRIIARYNFNKANTAFVHLNYLVTLSDSALRYLDVPLDTVRKMDQQQYERFSSYSFDSFDSGNAGFYRRVYLDPESYVKQIQERKANFKKRWEHKGWLSWNLAEDRAYGELFDRQDKYHGNQPF